MAGEPRMETRASRHRDLEKPGLGGSMELIPADVKNNSAIVKPLTSQSKIALYDDFS
jgi:hypothetical protein